jgi:uncharacterized heparinase superfamily protein
MSLTGKRQRLADLNAEVRRLEDFIAAVGRGEHDDEAAIAAAVASLAPPEPKRFFGSKKSRDRVSAEDIRQLHRLTLQKQAYDRMNNEIFPEIRQLQFELRLG